MDSAGHLDAGWAALTAAAIGVWFLVILAIMAFSIWIYWRIAVKAGYPGAYSLLMLVPVANLVLLVVFAFTDWPIELANRRLRLALAGGRMPPEPPAPDPPYSLVPPTSAPSAAPPPPPASPPPPQAPQAPTS
ncbi:MAG TPA: hypothetical protein VKF82_07470 [Candidatus Eremiobacteraceae bacterium]|nr:hypothetical protein [Candidatus Eremiobacteraceae bacterium]